MDRRVLTRDIKSTHEVGKVGTDQVQLYSQDGKLYAQLSSNDAVLISDLSVGSATPVGAVNAFAGTATAPAGWLLCNGNAVTNGSGTVQGQTADFSDLYALVSTTYGAEGTLPDLAGRVIAQEDVGTYDRGDEGGAASVALVEGNVPAHSHGLTDGTAIAGSTVGDSTGEGDYGKPWVNACMSITGGGETNAHRKVSVWNGASCVEATGYASQDASNLQNFDYYFDVDTALSGATDASTGSGSTHENRQPTLYMNYIIKF